VNEHVRNLDAFVPTHAIEGMPDPRYETVTDSADASSNLKQLDLVPLFHG
jgi:hypothetical protein